MKEEYEHRKKNSDQLIQLGDVFVMNNYIEGFYVSHIDIYCPQIYFLYI